MTMPTATHGLEWLHPTLDRCRALLANRPADRQWMKKGRDDQDELVTELDVAVETLLLEAIRTHVPSASVVSEESSHNEADLDDEWCFVIDPIDGTEEFVAGRPGYAISVALLHDGRPHAAVLDLPAHDQRFDCCQGTGTRLNGKPVELAPPQRFSEARLAVSATQLKLESLRQFWSSFEAAELVPTPGFAAKFAVVLSGRADAVLYLPVHPLTTAIWDYAAAAHLLAEAGGVFIDQHGQDLSQQRPFFYKTGWIAAPPHLRDPLLEIVREIAPPGEDE